MKRELYLTKIRPFYESDLIKVLIGIRRCGKSVLLKQIIDELQANGVEKDKIIYLNFEDLAFDSLRTGNALYEYVKDQMLDEKTKYYLFFDEIQEVTDFERVINSFRATHNASIFITGSNSRLLSGELATYLSGRYVSFMIYPFNFYEVCKIKELTDTQEIEHAFNDYLIWGGMPQRFQFSDVEETKVFLKDLYNSVVLRDIVQRANVQDVDALNRIIEYLAQTPSQTFSIGNISAYFESVNRKISIETIYNYLDHIATSFIAMKARRYDIRGKKILTTLDKYYLTDLGLNSIRNTGMKIEMGALLENLIYNELRTRGYDVYVGKIPKGEIDFIATKSGEKKYFQIAYYLTDEAVIDREFGALKAVKDSYPKYVITMDKIDFSRDGIIHKNVIDFLLDK